MKKGSNITILVRFFGSFKQISEQRELEFRLDKGASITNLLDQVFRSLPLMKKNLIDENGELIKWVMFLKNGRNIKIFSGVETILTDGDIISIFPPTAGG